MSEVNNLLAKNRIEDNLLNLKIISKIKENDKLSSQEKIIKIDPPSLLQGVYRWMNAEGRSITMEKLTNIINESMLITEGLLKREKELKENEYLDLQENNLEADKTRVLALNNLHEIAEKIKKELEEIKKDLEYCKTLYFSYLRSKPYFEKLKKLERHSKILDERLKLFLLL